nr:uncharacterized protein LOC120964989 [Aegilops tauschii subsp. strangulata]
MSARTGRGLALRGEGQRAEARPRVYGRSPEKEGRASGPEWLERDGGAAGHGELGRGQGEGRRASERHCGAVAGAGRRRHSPRAGRCGRAAAAAAEAAGAAQYVAQRGRSAWQRQVAARRGAVQREQRQTAMAVAGDGDGGERACVHASWTRRRRGGRLTGAVGILAKGRGKDDGDDASDDRDE